ncbi:MAG TPA: hypothetical protein PKZ08_13050, partial [Vicinamibacterales bacterium]|nr:hypothetical protein [Vicinamibacterales bacterium]
MTLRTRLSLAFFFISVVPLAVVTAYSYYSSAAALRHAVEAQADQMASEMGDRLTWVMADLGERVERLWRMRVQEPSALGAPRTAGALPSAVANSETLQHLAAAMLAEAAPLVRRLEFSSAADTAAVPGSAGAPPAQAPAQAESGGGRTGGRGGRARGAWQAPGAPSAGRAPESGPRGPAGRPQPPPGVPVVSPGMPKVVIDMPTARAAQGSANSEALFEALTPEAVNAWRRAIQRQAEMDADQAG